MTCAHVWKWVEPRIVVVGLSSDDATYTAETFNAECEKCGAHTWAHRSAA